MSDWRAQHYRTAARKAGVSNIIVAAANQTAAATRVVNNRVPVVLTLRHLAQLSGVHYGFLRKVISRHELDPYRSFRLRKRSLPGEVARFRRITIPHPPLMAVQKWIASNILAHGHVHDASVAFAPRCTLLEAAQPHCDAKWLIKVDIKNFFESVTERQAFRAFRALGYQSLVAFEMARLCTRVGSIEYRSRLPKWKVDSTRWSKISAYNYAFLGHLPQGAPTSPMLANLCFLPLDNAIQSVADEYGLNYTRYADDLALSTSDASFSRQKAKAVIDVIYRILRSHDFDPNLTKTKVSPPGSRKILLGLLVDGSTPKLSRDFKSTLRQHLYYLEKFGPSEHAARCKSGSIYGLKAHIAGLISHACQIEPDYAAERYAEFNRIPWP